MPEQNLYTFQQNDNESIDIANLFSYILMQSKMIL